MSDSLGEKLRQAREERGISIADVAEQTRISPHYLEAIENDDYRTLPGGIFNKGFVKSYAKHVGIDEQEALQDYSRLQAPVMGQDAEPEVKTYKPEVLTDDHASASRLPRIIGAVILLALITGGILFGLNYLNKEQDRAASPTPTPASESNSNSPAASPTPESAAPTMGSIKVEFKAVSEPVSLSATNDGKLSSSIVTPTTAATFEPKETLKLSYSRSLAALVQLFINGKAISLPAAPLSPKRNAIEFEINKDNIGQIWNAGSISTDVPPAVTTDANTAANASAPTVMPTAAAPKATPHTVKRAASNTAAPTASPKTATTPAPLPTRKVIVVGNAKPQ